MLTIGDDYGYLWSVALGQSKRKGISENRNVVGSRKLLLCSRAPLSLRATLLGCKAGNTLRELTTPSCSRQWHHKAITTWVVLCSHVGQDPYGVLRTLFQTCQLNLQTEVTPILQYLRGHVSIPSCSSELVG